MQYWLLNYGPTACPHTWTAFGADCYTNSVATRLSGAVPAVSALAGVTLTGTASATGNDTVVMTAATGNATAVNAGNVLSLASAWKGAEFGVFGDGNATQAKFSANTTLNVMTTTHSGTKLAPSCVYEGFTGETNNLNLSPTPALKTQNAPTLESIQTNTPGAVIPACATARGHGDTHLVTFGNLAYDFQASGDFQLAKTGTGLNVQTRQTSGAPAWPNAAVNQAVAAQVGASDVAVCLAPTRLEVNGQTMNLANGGQLNLPGGDDVSLNGNVYLIQDASGDSVTATVNAGNPNWIDVQVGLGRWPETVTGLLASAASNSNAIQSNGGTVLTPPFAFSQFYGQYGESWRVPPGQSLLSGCDPASGGDPQQVFYSGNLSPSVANAARAVCAGDGVQTTGLLDACTVDVAVLGSPAAATYAGQPTNVTWGQILPAPDTRGPALRRRG